MISDTETSSVSSATAVTPLATDNSFCEGKDKIPKQQNLFTFMSKWLFCNCKIVLKLLIIVLELLVAVGCEFMRDQCNGNPLLDSNSQECQECSECCGECGGESFTTTTEISTSSQGNWNGEIKICPKVTTSI